MFGCFLSKNFETTTKCKRNVLEGFSENQKVLKFPKSELFILKFWKFREESQYPERNFRKFWYTPQRFSFQKMPKTVVPLVAENFRKFQPEFWVAWKRLLCKHHHYLIAFCGINMLIQVCWKVRAFLCVKTSARFLL